MLQKEATQVAGRNPRRTVMNKLMHGIERFWKEEEGTEVVEWALVAGLIVAVGAAIFSAIGLNVKEILGTMNDALKKAGGTNDPA